MFTIEVIRVYPPNNHRPFCITCERPSYTATNNVRLTLTPIHNLDSNLFRVLNHWKWDLVISAAYVSRSRFQSQVCVLSNKSIRCESQSPAIICKAPTANRQRRWASYPTPWSTPTLDSVATSRDKTIIFNRLHIVNHSWSGVSTKIRI